MSEALTEVGQIPGGNPQAGVHAKSEQESAALQFHHGPEVAVMLVSLKAVDQQIGSEMSRPIGIVGKCGGAVPANPALLLRPRRAVELASFGQKARPLVLHAYCYLSPATMSAEMFVKLIDEMVDIKVHQRVESHLHSKPELARMLEEKRHTDRRRLETIKQELVRLISGPAA